MMRMTIMSLALIAALITFSMATFAKTTGKEDSMILQQEEPVYTTASISWWWQ